MEEIVQVFGEVMPHEHDVHPQDDGVTNEKQRKRDRVYLPCGLISNKKELVSKWVRVSFLVSTVCVKRDSSFSVCLFCRFGCWSRTMLFPNCRSSRSTTYPLSYGRSSSGMFISKNGSLSPSVMLAPPCLLI